MSGSLLLRASRTRENLFRARWLTSPIFNAAGSYSAFDAASDKPKPTPEPAAAASKAKSKKQAGGIRRGFFDAPTKRRDGRAPKRSDGGAEVVELKAPKRGADGLGASGRASRVPEFMRIDPASEEAQLQAMKGKLMDAMKPTPDMMQGVLKNPDLMKGFDDPEVMAAVSEIAADPSKMAKHKGNAKVMAFYQSMAGAMAARFDKLAAEEEASAGRGPAKTAQGDAPERSGQTRVPPSPLEPEPKRDTFRPIIEEL